MTNPILPAAPAAPEAQDPATATLAQPTPPQSVPKGAADRFNRAIKARADLLMQDRIDDQGRVLMERQAWGPKKAQKLAMMQFVSRMRADPRYRDEARQYLSGQIDSMPGWADPEGPEMSMETLMARAPMRDMEAARRESPVASFLYDLASPVSKFYGGMAQVPVDVGIGLANMVGRDIKPWDVRSNVIAAARKVAGQDTTAERTKMEMDMLDQSASGVFKVLQTAGTMAGELRSLFGKGFAPATGGGAVGTALRVAEAPAKLVMKGGAAAGRKGAAFFGAEKYSKLAEAMGAFGAYSGVTAPGTQDPETGEIRKATYTERAREAIFGALSGAVIHGSGEFARWALRGMFKSAATKLDPMAKGAVSAVQKWGQETGAKMLANESAETFGNRLIDGWIAAGAPGAPKMATRKLAYWAGRGGIESTGFSMLDAEFRADAYDAAMNGDAEAFERAMVKFMGNAIALGVIPARLADVPAAQRRQPTEPTKPQEPQPRETKAQQDAAMRQSAEEFGRAGRPEVEVEPTGGIGQVVVGGVEPQRLNAGTLRPVETPGKVDPATGTVMGREPAAPTAEAELQRYGWRDVDIGRPIEPGAEPSSTARMELPGTGFNFEIKGGQAYASPQLGELLGIKEPVEAREFADMLGRASLASALEAKRRLPGVEISADGVKAEQGEPGERSKMRTIRLGEVLESPLTAEPAWVSAKPFPARGKDMLGPEQSQAVEALRMVMNGRPDIEPKDRALLDSVINVLDTVAARSDQSVAETVAEMPQIMVGLSQGTPEQAGQFIRLTAEMLTTKAPDVAVSEMAAREASTIRVPSEMAPLFRQLIGKVAEQGPLLRSEMQSQPRKIAVELKPERLQQMREGIESEGPKAIRRLLGEAATPEEISRTMQRVRSVLGVTMIPARRVAELQAQEAAQAAEMAKKPKKPPQAKVGEPDLPPWATETMAETAIRQARAGESGFVAIPDASNLSSKEFVNVAGRVLAPFVDNPATRSFAQDLQTKVMERQPELGGRFLEVEADTHRYRDGWEPQIEEMSRLGANRRIPEFDRMHWVEPTERGITPGFTTAHVAKETVLAERLGFDVKKLPEPARKILGIWNGLTRSIREKAADLQMHLKNVFTPEGELVEIAREAKRDVLTRQPTIEASDAIMRGEGRLYDDIVDATASVNKMEPQAVREAFEQMAWTEARGVRRLDPVEMKRTFKFFPDHIKRPSGEIIKLLETNPFRHAKHMIAGASMRLATVGQFGQDIRTKQPEGGKPDAESGYGDGLPVPYRHIIESVPRGEQELIATAFRAAMGMPTTKLSSNIEIGSGYHKALQVLGAVNDLAAAAKMTFSSPLQNIVEPWSTGTAMLGPERMGRAQARVAQAIGDGTIGDLLRERFDAGGFALHAPEYIVGGEHGWMNKLRQYVTAGKNGMLIPFEFTQQATDMSVHMALHDAVNGWRRGESQSGDVAMLKSLYGFSDAHAQAMVKGEAPPRAYDNVALTGLPRITRRGDLPLNKSDWARSRGAANAIKFTGFFQRQVATLRRSITAMRDAKTPAEAKAASAQFLKLMGYNLAAYAASQTVVKFFQGGPDEVARFWAGQLEELSTPGGAAKVGGAAFLGSMLGGVGATLGGSIYALLSGDDEAKADALDRFAGSIPALGAITSTAEFGNAAIRTLVGAPVGEGPYAGKSPLQQLGYYAGQNVAAARAVENGLFGLGVTYLGTDPNLENALRASYQWDDRHLPKSKFAPNPDPAFHDAMRKAATQLKEPNADPGAVVAELMATLPDVEEKKFAASFRARKVFDGQGWDDLTEAQRQSKLRALGPDTVELLQGYDTALEAAASFFRKQHR